MSPGIWHWCCCGGPGGFGSLYCGSCQSTDSPVLGYWDGAAFQDDILWEYWTRSRSFHPMRIDPVTNYPMVLFERTPSPYSPFVKRYNGTGWDDNPMLVATQNIFGTWLTWYSHEIYDLGVASDGTVRILAYGESSNPYSPVTYSILAQLDTETDPECCTDTVLSTTTAPYCMCVKADDDVAWALFYSSTTLYCGPSDAAKESIPTEGGYDTDRYAIASSDTGKLYVLASKYKTRVYERTGAGSYTAREVYTGAGSNCDLTVRGSNVYVVYKYSNKYYVAIAEDGVWTWDTYEIYNDAAAEWGRASIAVLADGTVNVIISGKAGTANWNLLAIYSDGEDWIDTVVTRTDSWEVGGRVFIAPAPFNYP